MADSEEERQQLGGTEDQAACETRTPAAMELRKQTELLRVILSSVADAVLSSDTQHRISFMNTAAEKLTGWSQSEALTQPVSSVVQLINGDMSFKITDWMTLHTEASKLQSQPINTMLVDKDGHHNPD